MMKSILLYFLYGVISLHTAGAGWLIAFFGYDQGFWMSSLWGTGSGIVSFFFLSWVGERRLLKKNDMTKKEYRYIQKNLREANEKIKRLNKSLFGIRSFFAIKQFAKLRKLVGQIYSIVKNEPKRFYQAERFFFYHLDSIVELSDRYIFLSRQKIKDREVRMSLADTERTLEKLTKSIEEDLRIVVSDDIHDLQFELDVAKSSINRNNMLVTDERRNLNE